MNLCAVIPILIIAVLVIGVLKIFKAPLKLFVKLLINTIFGFIALLAINFLGGFFDVSIGISWINAAIVGVLGVPGVALLLLLQWLAII